MHIARSSASNASRAVRTASAPCAVRAAAWSSSWWNACCALPKRLAKPFFFFTGSLLASSWPNLAANDPWRFLSCFRRKSPEASCSRWGRGMTVHL